MMEKQFELANLCCLRSI